MTLFEQISQDIMASMKARDAVRTNTLRNIKKEFIEAKTAPSRMASSRMPMPSRLSQRW